MARGRKPQLMAAADQARDRYTRAEIEARTRSEPGGCSARLAVPRGMSAEAAREWRRVVRLYRQLSYTVACDLDTAVLTAYCESVAIYKRAQAEYQRAPIIFKDKRDDAVRENPWVKVLDREGAAIAKYAEQLCLSPVGRARMGAARANRESEADDMSALLESGPPSRGLRIVGG